MITRTALFAVAAVALLLPAVAEEAPRETWITFWNVENLFEPAKDGAERMNSKYWR